MAETAPPQVELFTDGAASPNPGPGGYGVLLRHESKTKEMSGGFALTTNNRMEILAVIVGLAALKRRCRVTVYSDSQYVVDTISKGWAKSWRSRGWRKYDKSPAANPDLWSRLLDLLDEHDVTMVWVRGHSGHRENERVDRLAVAASRGKALPPDPGYNPTAE